MAERVSGPASCFPSIEAKYGRTIAEWKTLMRGTGLTTHKELVTWLPKKTIVGVGTRSQFAMLSPSTPDRFDVGPKLSGVEPTERLEPAGSWNTLMTHRVRITDAKQVDHELIGWLRSAYELSNS